MRKLWVFAIPIMLMGCATDPIVMREPATGGTYNCGSRPWAPYGYGLFPRPWARTANRSDQIQMAEACENEHQAWGWVRED